MNRIEEKFRELKKKRAALMPYIPLGYPTIADSPCLIRAAVEEGADIIELGMPFSDPLADGPVIQKATQIALKNGMTLAKSLEIVSAGRREGITAPIVLMGYYNPILRYGVQSFAADAAEAGADGVIVPDLPPEEAEPLSQSCTVHNLDTIFLAAPTSTSARLKVIADATRGFLYLVSVTGVTGAHSQVARDLGEFAARVRAVTSKPICVGFGIANARSAAQVARIADGVIVGSALVARMGEDKPEPGVRAFIRELRAAIEI